MKQGGDPGGGGGGGGGGGRGAVGVHRVAREGVVRDGRSKALEDA